MQNTDNRLYITPAEASDIADMIQNYIFQMIRDDEDIDNMDWLCGMCKLYERITNMNPKGEDRHE